MNCRKVIVSALSLMAFIPSAGLAALSTDDYIEAAWMTTRFFGAQRSGEGPNWILDGTNYTKSFTKDNYNGKDVSGGWFDCGDHVMYGQSQGYASYILALGYSEFTKGFYDLYTGDYTDYKESKDYTRKGGKPNGVVTCSKNSVTRRTSGRKPLSAVRTSLPSRVMEMPTIPSG